MLGGTLWILYGVFEMLRPWGPDTVYRDDKGYEDVVDAGLYVLYSLPGSLALILTALGLLGVLELLELPSGRMRSIGRVLNYIALALGVLSVGGVILEFDPLFTAPRIFGTLALGAATFLTGVATSRATELRYWREILRIVGTLGLFLLPLWPLVYAIQWLSEGAGAAIITLFGLSWAFVGTRLWTAKYAPKGTRLETNQRT
jgi:hypothetical protein